jgi:3-isopropylmalate/(R)-2-methylmalate dehydratase small subunit
MEKYVGKIHKYGDNISTDLIIASRHLTKYLSDEEMAKYALEALDPEFARKVRPGDILVAGKNFGWGSSREEAIIALTSCGLKMVIARSFSRTFYRNGINRGSIYLLECDAIDSITTTGDELEVDIASGSIVNLSNEKSAVIIPLPLFIAKIVESGGLLNFIANEQEPGRAQPCTR